MPKSCKELCALEVCAQNAEPSLVCKVLKRSVLVRLTCCCALRAPHTYAKSSKPRPRQDTRVEERRKRERGREEARQEEMAGEHRK